MKPLPYTIPEKGRIRVIISTDARNEADDQFAIAYALMSPKLDVVGIIAAHFVTACNYEQCPYYGMDPALTTERSYEEILLILEKMGLSGKYPVLRGATEAMPNEHTPIDSEGARFIIEEAHKPGAPLYIINLGAITDLSSAYLLDPTIADGIEAALWLGGSQFPEGGFEFNLSNDIPAGNVLMDSRLNVHLLPGNSTAPIKIAYSELFLRVRPFGEIGRYLCDHMVEWGVQCGALCESWVLWDIAAVALLLNSHPFQYHTRNAPRFGPDMRYIECQREHIIRVYDRVEPRFALEDMFCKLELCFDRLPD